MGASAVSQYSFVDEEPTKGRYSFVEEPKKGSGNPFIDAALGLGRAARDVIDGPAYLLEKGVRAISPSAAGAVNQAGGALGMDTRPVSDINAEAERQYQDATPGSFTAGTARVAGNVLGAFMPGTGQISAARKANQLWSAGGAANKALSLGAAGGLGAAQSALMNTKTDQDSFTNNAIGGGLGAGAGQIGTAALGSMYRGARGALQGETGLAGRILADVAEDPASVLARLKAGRELVPGSKPMTHQLAEDAGISQLARTVKTAGATGLTDREISQNLARVSVLRDLAGDEGKMAAAINARTSRAGPLYGVAKDVVVPVDDQLKALLDRPSMQAAVKRAERLAQESGQKLDLSG
jgi:hypothetical protein